MASADLGPLDKRIRFERPVRDESFMGEGSGAWQTVIEVWATVMDVLPSRSESLDADIDIAARPTRIRMRWQPDLDASMRIALGSLDAPEGEGDPLPADRRYLQIDAGPAEIGRQYGIELIATEFSTAGNPA